jgi:predicted PurR-regulated permease PerM
MITNGWVRITAWAAGLLAVAAALHIVQLLYSPIVAPALQVIYPLCIALALALLLDPTIDKLERRGLPRGVSVGLVAIVFVAAIVLLAMFLVPALIGQAKELADHSGTYYREASTGINQLLVRYEDTLKKLRLPTTVEGLTSRYNGQIQNLAKNSFSGVASFLGIVLSKAIWLFLIPIITIFLLMDIDKIKMKALICVPEKHRSHTAKIVSSIGQCFGAYIRGLVTVGFLYGVACGLLVALLGVPYSIMLGAAAGILYLVPYAGAIITVVLIGGVAYVGNPAHPMTAVWAMVLLIVMNQVFDSIVSPHIVGKAVKLHPVLSLSSLLIGGSMFGLVGMILAVPVAASIQIVILEFCPQLKGPEEEEKPKPSLLKRLLFRKKQQKSEK